LSVLISKGMEFLRELDKLAHRASRYIVKSEEATDERYGHYPFERPINLYIEYGFIPLDKPPGPTSHEVVAWIKKMFSIEKAGHGGTLEPKPPRLVVWVGIPQGNWGTTHSIGEGNESYRSVNALKQRICYTHGAS
jgi:hypothetical protein